MVDKNTVQQVLCSLMRHPQYLSEKDKYNLTAKDFPTRFDSCVFTAIYNLYQGGAPVITVVDISNYFDTHEVAKAIFERENGIEVLQDALDFTQVENFPFYYNRLKKINCLRDLQKMGINTSSIYCEDLTNPKAKEINDRFEQLQVKDIFDTLKRKVMNLETNYSSGDASETEDAASSIRALMEELKLRPEVGAPLQGRIFNTISRGARSSKFYIRTCSSGVGKTRQAVGDMCYLSYPVRFNPESWEWEYNGSNEKSLFIATEQKIDEIQTMILAYISGFDEEKFLYNNFNDTERKIVDQTMEVMEAFKDNVFIVTLPDPSIEQIKAVVRQNWIIHDIKNVFYDYIFSSPNLLNEFRDLHIREDVALGMLSTALKDLAVEMDLFVESSTQTNAKASDEGGDKNETVIRGSRAIIDKCDLGCVVTPISQNDKDLLETYLAQTGYMPTHVTDIYKVRRGKYTKVKIWSKLDLGTCRKEDLFITNLDYKPMEDFMEVEFKFSEELANIVMPLIKNWNLEKGVLMSQAELSLKAAEKEDKKIDIEDVVLEKSDNMFEGMW